MAEHFDHRPIHDGFMGRTKPRFAMNAVGIEIELETRPSTGMYFGNPDVPESWTVHEDNSLGSGGVEFVLAQPYAVNNLEGKVTILLDYLEKSLPRDHTFVTSRRTGLHYHLNVEQKTPVQYMTNYMGFLCLEPFLVHSQRYRDESLFCLPTWQAEFSLRHMIGEIRNGMAPNGEKILQWLSQQAGMNNRYRAINTVPINKGSIEFRCFESTLDPEKILHWPRVFLSVLEKTEGMTLHDFRSLISKQELVDWSVSLAEGSPLLRPAIEKAIQTLSPYYIDLLYQAVITLSTYVDQVKATKDVQPARQIAQPPNRVRAPTPPRFTFRDPSDLSPVEDDEPFDDDNPSWEALEREREYIARLDREADGENAREAALERLRENMRDQNRNPFA